MDDLVWGGGLDWDVAGTEKLGGKKSITGTPLRRDATRGHLAAIIDVFEVAMQPAKP